MQCVSDGVLQQFRGLRGTEVDGMPPDDITVLLIVNKKQEEDRVAFAQRVLRDQLRSVNSL